MEEERGGGRRREMHFCLALHVFSHSPHMSWRFRKDMGGSEVGDEWRSRSSVGCHTVWLCD